jgi:hypothetical protein
VDEVFLAASVPPAGCPERWPSFFDRTFGWFGDLFRGDDDDRDHDDDDDDRDRERDVRRDPNRWERAPEPRRERGRVRVWIRDAPTYMNDEARRRKKDKDRRGY